MYISTHVRTYVCISQCKTRTDCRSVDVCTAMVFLYIHPLLYRSWDIINGTSHLVHSSEVSCISSVGGFELASQSVLCREVPSTHIQTCACTYFAFSLKLRVVFSQLLFRISQSCVVHMHTLHNHNTDFTIVTITNVTITNVTITSYTITNVTITSYTITNVTQCHHHQCHNHQ